MTREEAIKALIKERKTALHENKQAFDMAIKALEQEPSEDCVSRQAVLAKINDWWGITSTSGEPTLCDCIRDLPPVTPTQSSSPAISLDKVKQAREEIENEIKFWSEPSKYNVKPIVAIKNAKAQSYKHCLEILNKLMAESEEK